jgi:hypothetical protein
MRTDKEKLQPLVREIIAARRDGLSFLCNLLENVLGVLPDLISTRGIDETIARGVQQPGFRFFGNSIRGPPLQSRHECFAERVFRSGDLA